MRSLPLLALALAPAALAAQAADSAAVFKAARAAEADYEFAARHHAPIAGRARRTGSCDEVVGRFCLTYDGGRDPLPPEPAEITRRRDQAIEKLRAAFELNRARVATVFPLIRLLLEGEQPAAAEAVASAFQQAGGDVATAHLLAALTHHAAARIPEAEAAIERWLSTQDTSGRRRLEDLNGLLQRRERSRYRELTPSERSFYESRFWRYADALYLTPGNEVRTEHFARHAESRLLESAPWVRGATSWGSDVAQLTIRYGAPKSRSRSWPGSGFSTDLELIEHFDPEQMIYAPPALDSVLSVRARPALGWPMDTVRSISGHAPSTIRRMLPLEHQATVYHTGDGRSWLRIDGHVAVDSAARGQSTVKRALVLLDAQLHELARVEDSAEIVRDTLQFRMEMPLPDSAAFYSAELLEPGTRLAARARFPLERPAANAGLQLSDVLIAEPFPPGGLPASREDHIQPKTAVIIGRGQPFGVFAELMTQVDRPDTLYVELELLAIDGSPALLRAARWLGRRLGMGEEAPPNRLSWSSEVQPPGRMVIAVTIDPTALKPGRYFLDLSVTDRQSDRRVQVRREILID